MKKLAPRLSTLAVLAIAFSLENGCSSNHPQEEIPGAETPPVADSGASSPAANTDIVPPADPGPGPAPDLATANSSTSIASSETPADAVATPPAPPAEEAAKAPETAETEKAVSHVKKKHRRRIAASRKSPAAPTELASAPSAAPGSMTTPPGSTPEVAPVVQPAFDAAPSPLPMPSEAAPAVPSPLPIATVPPVQAVQQPEPPRNMNPEPVRQAELLNEEPFYRKKSVIGGVLLLVVGALGLSFVKSRKNSG